MDNELYLLIRDHLEQIATLRDCAIAREISRLLIIELNKYITPLSVRIKDYDL